MNLFLGSLPGLLIFASTLCMAAPASDENSFKSADSASGFHNTRLILLGTGGGPITRSERSQPANLIIVNGHNYLIDAGDGTPKRLNEAGVTAKDLDAIFLTHLHLDHTLGMAPILASRWLTNNKQALPVYGPPGTRELINGAYAYLNISTPLHAVALPGRAALEATAEVFINDLSASTVIYKDERLTVTAVKNSHYFWDDTKPYGHDLSFAYRFDTEDRSIVFTGDTGPSPAIEALAYKADILVAETMDYQQTADFIGSHYSKGKQGDIDKKIKKTMDFMANHHLLPKEIAKMGARAKVGMIVLNHISPGPDGDKNLGRFREEMKAYYKGPIIVGRDLVEF